MTILHANLELPTIGNCAIGYDRKYFKKQSLQSLWIELEEVFENQNVQSHSEIEMTVFQLRV
jgi:hypothetical protein